MIVYIVGIILVVLALLSVFLYVLERKIDRLEDVIMQSFRFRSSLIPGLFEITQNTFTKHDLIFQHILELRMQEALQNHSNNSIDHLLYIEQSIHKELNFIFKVANKHPKLLKNPKFVYIRDLFVESSYMIGKYLDMYKSIVRIYNNYVVIKNYSIIGLLLPISAKSEI